jgi:hypothetical protein
MPQFTPVEIEGLRRCFVPYVMLEEDRWPEIAIAEQLSTEGDKKWEILMDECRGRFFNQFEAERDDT